MGGHGKVRMESETRRTVMQARNRLSAQPTSNRWHRYLLSLFPRSLLARAHCRGIPLHSHPRTRSCAAQAATRPRCEPQADRDRKRSAKPLDKAIGRSGAIQPVCLCPLLACGCVRVAPRTPNASSALPVPGARVARGRGTLAPEPCIFARLATNKRKQRRDRKSTLLDLPGEVTDRARSSSSAAESERARGDEWARASGEVRSEIRLSPPHPRAPPSPPRPPDVRIPGTITRPFASPCFPRTSLVFSRRQNPNEG